MALSKWWDRRECDKAIQLLRLHPKAEWFAGHASMPVIVAEDASRGRVIKSVRANVCYQLDRGQHSRALIAMVLLVWLYGYEKGLLKGECWN